MPTFGSMARRLITRLRDERGFTLIEQLICAMGLVLIVGAIAGMTEVTQRMAPSDNERSHALRDAQVGMDRMTRELRHAYSFGGAIAQNKIVANVALRGRTYQVTYDCTVGHPQGGGLTRCVRIEGTNTQVVVDKVINAGLSDNARRIFRVDPPRDGTTFYVRTRLEVPAGGERKLGNGKNGSQTHRVTLEDGIYFRNIHASRP